MSVIASDGGYVYDFGENNAGVVCLRVNGVSGQKITFDFGEVLIDGKLNKDNIVCDLVCDDYKWQYVQHDEYICTDGWQTWIPSLRDRVDGRTGNCRRTAIHSVA